MANEMAQWFVIFILLCLVIIGYLTALDEKFDILRPRYTREEPKRRRRR